MRHSGGILRFACYPCPVRAGSVPPGRLRACTGLPYLSTDPDCSGVFVATVLAAVSFSLTGVFLGGRSQPHGCRAPVWASLNASSTASSRDDLSSQLHVDTRLREFSFATCSGLQATPESVVTQNPWAASSAPGLRLSASEDCSSFLFVLRLGTGFCEESTSLPRRRFQPRGS